MNEKLTRTIIGCAIEVHRILGPGLLESAYVKCLSWELTKSGLFVESEKPVALTYKDIYLDCGYRADLIVENSIIIEAKAVKSVTDIDLAQILTYLKLTNCQLGLLMNFNELRLIDGLRRVVNNYER